MATGARMSSPDMLMLKGLISELPDAQRAEVQLVKERITTVLLGASKPEIAALALGWVGLEATERL